MLFPINMSKIEKMSREEVNEMAGILAYLFANEIEQRPDKSLTTMPIRDKTCVNHVIEFNPGNDLVSNHHTTLILKEIT